MCVRITRRRSHGELREVLNLPVPSILETWNHPPGYAVMTLRKDVPSPWAQYPYPPGIRLDMLEWGYREAWMARPDARIRVPLPNATAEKAVDVRSLSNAGLRERRCIVIADGWYEWPRLGKRRLENRPHFIRFEGDRVFGFAGIWGRFDPEPGAKTPHDTVAILTVEANELLKQLPCPRMPVIILPGDWDTWLSIETSGNRIIDFLKPWPSRHLEMWPVDPAMNNAKYNGPQCIEPTGATIRLAYG